MNREKEGPEFSKLAAEHTPSVVADRLALDPSPNYLRDFIYGAIDGCVTTFAIVSGVVGAELSSAVVIILGLSNVLADGFSMAVSNYLGTKASQQLLHRARSIEERHVELIPEGEIEEIRQIFQKKGFEDDLLAQVVEVITADRELWIDTMLKEEWGLSLSPTSPTKAAGVTFASFVLVGLIPLLPFLLLFSTGVSDERLFTMSIVLTALTFLSIGALKSRFVLESWWRAGAETLAMGGGAAALAYTVGVLLKDVG